MVYVSYLVVIIVVVFLQAHTYLAVKTITIYLVKRFKTWIYTWHNFFFISAFTKKICYFFFKVKKYVKEIFLPTCLCKIKQTNSLRHQTLNIIYFATIQVIHITLSFLNCWSYEAETLTECFHHENILDQNN